MVMEASAGALRCQREAGDVAGRVLAGAGIVDHAAEVNVRANLAAQFIFRDDAKRVMEFALNESGGFGEAVEVRLLGGNFEMAAARKVASDIFLAHDVLDAIDGSKRCRIHAANFFHTVARDERGNGELESRQNHAAIARAGAPAEGFGFENGDADAALGQRARGGKAGETGADDGDINAFGQRAAVGIAGRNGNGSEPIVFFCDRHDGVLRAGEILTLVETNQAIREFMHEAWPDRLVKSCEEPGA